MKSSVSWHTLIGFLFLLPFANGQTVHGSLAFTGVAKPINLGFYTPPALDYQYTSSCEAVNLRVPNAQLDIPEAGLEGPTFVKLEMVSQYQVAPIPGELINLISQRRVVRLSPDGEATQARFALTISFESSRMPAWASMNDLRAMAYHKDEKAWKDALIVAVDQEQSTLTIEGDQFSDFVAGVIQSPEHPTAKGFAQTEIKDFQAVAPNAGITSVAAPQANNRGSAEISYPLTIPRGRAGMEPSAQLSYSSEAGNGYLGKGWSYPIATISVDTRWGVPEFHRTKESETYLYKGSQLFPVANREEWVPRQRERSFRPRREQAFSRIIRHGNSPGNYWWEVIHKNGGRDFYGGTPENGPLASTALGNNDGISTWFLVRSEDANGNNIRVSNTNYSRSRGRDNDFSLGVNRYLKSIKYTGHGTQDGYYSLDFVLDKDLQEPLRTDVFDDCGHGYKRSTAYLLRQIIVKVNGGKLRTYDLQYAPSPLGKQLLRKITHLDRSENTFFDHHFNYFDDLTVNGTFTPLFPGKTTSGVRDRLEGNLLTNVGRTDEPSMLGGNRSSSFYAGVAITVGPPGSFTCKNNTGGFSYTFSKTSGHGINSFVDINGDSRPDKVFVDDGTLKFRANLGLNDGGIIEFSPTAENLDLAGAFGIDNFSKSETKSHSFGPEASINIGGGGFGVGGYVAKSTTKSKTKHPVYFEDFNADGLIDLVFNNKVFFNHLANGIPTFTRESIPTLNPIRTGSPISSDLAFDDTEDLEDGEEPVSFQEANPLHDVVRAWRVPFDGHVRVRGSVQLLRQNNPEFENYTLKDGVVAIIENDEEEEWRRTINANDFSPKTFNDVYHVRKDKLLFFRLQSRDDGLYDQVAWDPIIEYVDEDTEMPLDFPDPDGRNYYRYRASEDFLLASPQQVGMPESGEIRIQGPVMKEPVTDTVRLQVIKYYFESEAEDADELSEVLLEEILLPGQIVDDVFSQNAFINENDRLNFMMTTHSNIDWKKVSWEPTIEYLQFREDDGSLTSAIFDDGTPIIAPIRAAVTPTMFNHVLSSQPRVGVVNPDDALTVRASFSYTNTVPPIRPYTPDTENGEPAPKITLVVKGPGKIYGAEDVSLNINDFFRPAAEIEVPAGGLESDSIYIDLIYSSKQFAEWSGGVVQTTLNGRIVRPNVQALNSIEDFAFGSLYRGWGQFAYRGEGEAGENTIDPDKVKESIRKYADNSRSFSDDPEELDEMLNPTNDEVALFYVSTRHPRWEGYDEFTYVEATVMSSSRLGEDNELTVDVIGVDSRLTAATKISKSKSKGTSGNISLSNPFIPGTSGSFQSSTTRSLQHTVNIDLNKDGYPDEFANGRAQLSWPWGGRRENTIPINHPSHRSEATVESFEPGGVIRQAKIVNTYDADKNLISSDLKGITSVSVGLSSLGANHTFGNGTGIGVRTSTARDKDRATYSWLDINGDGLPDRVAETGEVRLGLGFGFTALNNYVFPGIRKGVNTTESWGATLSDSIPDIGGKDKNKCKGSWTLGVTLKEDINYTTLAHQDVTGDGLPDILDVADGDLYVRINLGRNYLPRRLWKENYQVDRGYTASESLNGAFTICFNFIFVRFCVNPKGGVSRAVSSTRSRIMDIDGDGYADLLESDKEDEITYYRSRIGRTELLREVVNPLGNRVAMDYELLPASYEKASGQYVLAEVLQEDGLEDDGEDPARLEFHYRNPFHDRKEREFYGYAQVVQEEINPDTNEPYRTITQDFATSTYYLQGLLLKERMEDAAGKTWTSLVNTYELRSPGSMAVLPMDYAEVGQSVFVARTQVQSNEFEGNTTPLRSRLIKYTYDDIANIVAFEDAGDGSADDLVRAEIDYHPATLRNVADAPRRISVISGAGTLLRRREADIDAAGNPVSIRQFIASTEAIETTMEYDDFGNLTKIVRPPNLHGDRFSHEISYDEVVNTYPTEVMDAFGYRSSTTYEYDYGLPLIEKDINGQEIHRTYDNRGRLLTLTGPRELATGQAYTIAMEYHPLGGNDQLPYAICKHYDEEHGQDILTYTFIDGLGRPVQVKKSAVIWENGTEREGVMTVSGKQLYDAFGRVTAAYHPTTAPAASAQTYIAQPDDITPTRTTYDVLNRSVTVSLPDGSVTTMQHGIQPLDGRPMTYQETSDPLGNRNETYTDLRGRKLQMVAYGPDGPITTRFNYNLVSDLLDVTDTEGNKTAYTYDLLGRKTSMEHPLTGLTTMQLDPVGNIVAKSTPNIRERIGPRASIRYDYDYERLKSITYPLNYQNNVRYTYGGPEAKFNRIGRLVLQEDGSGAQEFFYGRLGETVKTIRTVVVNPTMALTYVWEASYDSWNRLQTMTYPDGEILDYGYNEAGKLSHLTGKRGREDYQYVDAVGYDKFEARSYMKLGNGTEHTYRYEADRRRLKNMTAGGATAGTFMDNEYHYDAVDNILRIENVASPREGQIGGSSSSSFQYDELYRLTEADGTFTQRGREETYSLSMAYDNVHNILSKDQLRQRDGIMTTTGTYANGYTYGNSRPFSPSTIGNRRFEYDANGNLTAVTDPDRNRTRDLFWDEENRLMAVQDAGYLSQYSYDASGERIIKSHGPTRGMAFNGAGGGFVEHDADFTAYVSPFFVAGQERFTKHYFIEGQRISSKIGQGQFNNNTANPGQGRLTAGNLDFVARIRQLQQDLRARYQEGLTPHHPDQPFFYATPEQTGEQYPELFPDSIPLIVGENARGGLPAYDPNSIHPAYEWRNADFDTVRAGFGLLNPDLLPREVLQYFYHSDHLGSTAYVTSIDGNISQFTGYTAFGEAFAEGQRTDAPGSSQPYLFNGKELDRETGLYYYGARYYDPTTSLWASVDPLMEKYAGWSPYNYVMQNPVKFVDPDGRETRPWAQNLSQEVVEGVFRKPADTKNLSEKYGATMESLYNNRIGHYTGEKNPVNEDGSPNFSVPPINRTDGVSRIHDIIYGDRDAAGPRDLLLNPNVIDADIEFVQSQFGIVFGKSSTITERIQSSVAGAVLGLAITPKVLVNFGMDRTYNLPRKGRDL
jgi:RHS repeat-associated protein